jgi:hypothetical protein
LEGFIGGLLVSSGFKECVGKGKVRIGDLDQIQVG